MSDSVVTAEQLETAARRAFDEWTAKFPQMDLPDGARSLFVAGFAAGVPHGVRLVNLMMVKEDS